MKRFEDVRIREATEADIHDFYGGPVEWRLQAWVAEYQGVLTAVAGIRFSEMAMVVFSDMRACAAPKSLCVRVSRLLMDRIRATNLPVITVALEDPPGSGQYNAQKGRFLELMGFTYQRWDDQGYAVFDLR